MKKTQKMIQSENSSIPKKTKTLKRHGRKTSRMMVRLTQTVANMAIDLQHVDVENSTISQFLMYQGHAFPSHIEEESKKRVNVMSRSQCAPRSPTKPLTRLSAQRRDAYYYPNMGIV